MEADESVMVRRKYDRGAHRVQHQHWGSITTVFSANKRSHLTYCTIYY